MKGILINSRQIEYFKVMLKKGYDDGDFGSRHKALGALELLLNQPQEEWVPALNIGPKLDGNTFTFADDIAHEKEE